jgi:hypothetical protein
MDISSRPRGLSLFLFGTFCCDSYTRMRSYSFEAWPCNRMTGIKGGERNAANLRHFLKVMRERRWKKNADSLGESTLRLRYLKNKAHSLLLEVAWCKVAPASYITCKKVYQQFIFGPGAYWLQPPVRSHMTGARFLGGLTGARQQLWSRHPSSVHLVICSDIPSVQPRLTQMSSIVRIMYMYTVMDSHWPKSEVRSCDCWLVTDYSLTVKWLWLFFSQHETGDEIGHSSFVSCSVTYVFIVFNHVR